MLKTYVICNLEFPLVIFSTIYTLCVFESSPKIVFVSHSGAVELLNNQSHSVLVFEYSGNVIRSSSEFRQGEYPDGLSRLFSDGAQMRRFLRFWIFFWLTGLLNFEIFSRVEFKERLLSHIFRGTLPPKLIESWCNQKKMKFQPRIVFFRSHHFFTFFRFL